MQDEEYVFRISGNKHRLHDYGRLLSDNGYHLSSEYTFIAHYEKTASSDPRSDIRFLKKMSRRRFTCEKIPKRFTRSADYRSTFFKNNSPKNGRYRCVYCGRWLKPEKVTVDHIIPVDAARQKRIQRKLDRIGYSGVNDVRNLAPACRRCNRRKSSKMGWWLIKARLGRHDSFWVIKPTVMLATAFIICYFLMSHPHLTEDIVSYVLITITKLVYMLHNNFA